jgi:GT2 family glycosyltransferase
MKLSVIIVNYNVRAYLEQCLRTVYKALEGIEGEVFVVDNLSTDGSVEMVREKFPEVQLIANTVNVGFSRANNQAIRISKGEYVLLLNPDTVVGEDTFHTVIGHMDAHPKIGGLGVKMIDGTGSFLPESKRGLPTPKVAFFKISGLSRLFPRSRVFGRYHLGHLPENEAAPIEILSGACMFLRKKTLDEVGLLDENFFMYGEDIDLSYRITLAGYENWYLPQARIIHYKGESTKKSSVNYVFVFYNAMAIFARKHFSGKGGGIFPALINASIYLSAAGAIAIRFFDRALLPLLDIVMVLIVLALSPIVPERWPALQELGLDVVLGLLIAGWIALFGGYDRPFRIGRPLKALISLLAILLVICWTLETDTSLIIEIIRASAVIGFGTAIIRSTLRAIRFNGSALRRKERERILAVGSISATRKALALLWQTHYGLAFTKVVPATTAERPIGELIREHRIGEVVFCARDIAWGRIIQLMEELKDRKTIFKIAQPSNEFIIGPSSIESLNDLFLMEEHTLNDPAARRQKRIFDISLTLFLLVLSPILALFTSSPGRFITNCIKVLRGERSWIGYRKGAGTMPRLPIIPEGIIDPLNGENTISERATMRANILYAKDYSPLSDLVLFLKGLRRAGSA